jgi:hypothetical protein
VGVCFIVEKKKKGNRKQRRGGEESVCGGHEIPYFCDNSNYLWSDCHRLNLLHDNTPTLIA